MWYFTKSLTEIIDIHSVYAHHLIKTSTMIFWTHVVTDTGFNRKRRADHQCILSLSWERLMPLYIDIDIQFTVVGKNKFCTCKTLIILVLNYFRHFHHMRWRLSFRTEILELIFRNHFSFWQDRYQKLYWSYL